MYRYVCGAAPVSAARTARPKRPYLNNHKEYPQASHDTHVSPREYVAQGLALAIGGGHGVSEEVGNALVLGFRVATGGNGNPGSTNAKRGYCCKEVQGDITTIEYRPFLQTHEHEVEAYIVVFVPVARL